MNAYDHYQDLQIKRAVGIDKDPVPEGGPGECAWYGCGNEADMDIFTVHGEDVLRFCSNEHLQKYIRDQHDELIAERELGN